jgi:vacuolar protein sorting-associated protein 52
MALGCREVTLRLQAFLDKVAVSAEMVRTVCDGPIDSMFIDDIRSLSDKLSFAMSHRRRRSTDEAGEEGSDQTTTALLQNLGIDPFETAAGRDALPQLETLRYRAVTRCRNHLLQCIEELRRPKTNPQQYQAHVLLKHRALMAFLNLHAPDVASEVVSAYVSLWGKALHGLIRSYYSGLHRMCAPMATATDLIVPSDLGAARGFFSARTSRDPMNVTALTLLHRPTVLKRANEPPDPVHVVESSGRPLAYEEVFRSTQRHLVELAATEHAFCLAFFGKVAGPKAYALVLSHPISSFLESLEEYLYTCHDAIALLLMIHLTYLHRASAVEGLTADRDPSEASSSAQAAAAAVADSSSPTDEEKEADRKRERGEIDDSDAVVAPPRNALPVMEAFFDRVTMLLWPRFKMVLDEQLASVKTADPSKMGRISLAPHFVTLRYAELAASILVLNRSLRRMGGAGDDMLRHNMAMLRADFEALLGKIASAHPSREVRVAFLHNNYRKCAVVLRERHAPEDELQHFEDAASAQADLFASEALRAHFGRMVTLVERSEREMLTRAMSSGLMEPMELEDALDAAPRGKGGELTLPPEVSPSLDKVEAEAVVRDFSATWSAALSRINDAVQRLVGTVDAMGALEVLKKTTFRMLSLYTRLLDAVRRAIPGTPPFMRDAVSVTIIMRDIQQYARAGQQAAARAESSATEASATSAE